MTETIDEIRDQLRSALAERDTLREAIRTHRDQRGDDRCFLDDYQLYAHLPGENSVDLSLPQKCEFLKSCERFWEQRQSPADRNRPADSTRTIAQLECENKSLRAVLRGADDHPAADLVDFLVDRLVNVHRENPNTDYLLAARMLAKSMRSAEYE